MAEGEQRHALMDTSCGSAHLVVHFVLERDEVTPTIVSTDEQCNQSQQEL